MRDKPRDRTMPLVPEPFDETVISRQSVFFGGLGGLPMAQTFCRFCPNLDFRQYLQSLSEDKCTEINKRASKLFKRAIVNHFYGSSEFSWEVCAWNDAFGLILDDEGLRMDKRPYDFIEKDDNGEISVKIRIPDATMGLKSYDDYFLKRGYVCEDPDCKDDHSAKQPDERLSEDLLSAMMGNPECGLIVDGVWGKTNLIFPFAVYEAKKRATSYAAAEEQIYHACRTYLAMLDDLARNPDNVSEYQSEDSDKYQLFAFTSCGSYWQVFLAWNFLNDCMVETIWEGDVKKTSSAIELMCLVDQVHDYATQQHRPFVMKHLEAWHDRHKRTAKVAAPGGNPTKTAFEGFASEPEDFDSSDDEDKSLSPSPLDSNDMARLPDLTPYLLRPAWSRLKEESEMTRNEKAHQTRVHNQELRSLATSAPNIETTPTQKRPRGRPPKAAIRKQKLSGKSQQAGSTGTMSGRVVKKAKSSSSRVTRSMKKGI